MSAAPNFQNILMNQLATPLLYDFWPAVEEGSKKILLVMHGRGDDLKGFQWLPEALDLDAFNYLFLQAPDPWDRGYSWYDRAPNQAAGILRSRKLLLDLLEELPGQCQIQSPDIFLFGFSQGCLMALDVGLRYEKLLGGIAGSSGYLFFEEEYPAALAKNISYQRFFINHGFQDDMLDFEHSKKSIQRLISLGVPIDWSELDKAHTVSQEEIILLKNFYQRLLDAS